MLTALVLFLRSIGLICRGHRAVALEHLALRQQLAVFSRTYHVLQRERDPEELGERAESRSAA